MRFLPGVLLVPVLVGAIAAAGCGGASEGKRETVVAGFYPLAWVARRVGGPGLHVVDLTPSGAEPHDLELTPRDVRAIQDADLVLYLGDGFQPAVEKAAEKRPGRALDLLAGQTLVAERTVRGGTFAADPHVWLDPSRLAAMATVVGHALGRPRAARGLVSRLDALDAEMRAGLASCRRHEIVTSHAAFGYLARRYGLEQVSLAGLSPEAEPAPRDLERLVHEVERSRATTVFFEPLVSPRLADTIAREAHVRTATLDPLEGLTPDEASSGDDYLSIMRGNLSTLRRALGCR